MSCGCHVAICFSMFSIYVTLNDMNIYITCFVPMSNNFQTNLPCTKQFSTDWGPRTFTQKATIARCGFPAKKKNIATNRQRCGEYMEDGYIYWAKWFTVVVALAGYGFIWISWVLFERGGQTANSYSYSSGNEFIFTHLFFGSEKSATKT